VCSFNYQAKRCDVYDTKAKEDLPDNMKTASMAGLAFGFGQFVTYAVFALTFWYGGKLMADGTHNFREVMIASMGVLMGAMGAGETGGFAAKAENADQAAKRVFAIVDRTPTIDVCAVGDTNLDADDADSHGKYPKGGCHIELDGVEFVYPARPLAKVLDGFSATMMDKQFIGLMGSTGCGKSTIMQQLCRFYDPDEGRVLINGKDMRTLDMKTWRESISIVAQEPALFSGTVKENIRYAKPDATDEEIIEMAKLCAIHDDILQMPDGYDTDVGYKGRQLSGGQKQRVAMARGLLRRPRLLLLDEATSALDNATEAKVQDGLHEVVKHHPMTVVSIAHRLTTIDKSDRIFLLDQGKVVEEGSHEELMAAGEDGEYRKRYELFQASSAALGNGSPSATAA
jgi:ATP-binding cassette subfamily B (MDR/TAP) protein 1